MRLRKAAAWGLVVVTILGLGVPGVGAAGATEGRSSASTGISDGDRQTQIQTATEEQRLPGTQRTFFGSEDSIREYFNVSGYVAEGVQDRSEYYDEYVQNGERSTDNYVVVEEDGYWKTGPEDYLSREAYAALEGSEKTGYVAVTAEQQFARALDKRPKVIQVNAEELELGFHYLEMIGASTSGIAAATDYTKGDGGGKNVPITNPVIMHKDDEGFPEKISSVFPNTFEGTGVSDLNLYSHMTIFSTTGCIIRHAGIDVGGCEDVIIRNFRFEGMYEWDENKNYATDSRKRYGWCNVSLNGSKDIWVDHCTFGFAFDGNLDIKNGSSVTVTWCQFGVQDLDTAGEENLETLPKWNESQGCELWKNILYMEECYQKYKAGEAKDEDGNLQNAYPYYAQYRDSGVTVKEIFDYAALHSKVHLCGSGEGDFYTNVQEKITLGFNYYTNIMQRIPMIRSGNGHMYNCIVDNADYQENAKKVAQKVQAAGYSRGYTTYISVNNARNGATIGTDTCIFNEVTPCCGLEIQNDFEDSLWNGIFGSVPNNNLVVNSKVTLSGTTYTGSSWDNNGENLFTSDKWTWNGGKSSIGDFKWAKWEGLDEFLNGTDYYADRFISRITRYVRDYGGGSFARTYYKGQEELEYAYTCFDLDEVEEKLSQYGGARKDLYGVDGTPAEYIRPYNRNETVGTLGNVNGDVDEDGNPIIDSKDALAVLKYSLQLDPGENFDAAVANVNGDVDEDGNPIIDSKDALEILKYSLHLIDKFSAEELR